MRVFYIPGHEAHAIPDHPENPRRIAWILEYLDADPLSVEMEDVLLRIHDAHYVNRIREVDRLVFLDPDTYVLPETYRVALRALSAAYEAPEGSFVLTRPPGHHASRDRGAGFCIFNNAVSAALSFSDRGERVGILDLDAHHGNGTEALVRGTDILYASIHMGRGYPGTGRKSYGSVLNIPVDVPVTGVTYMRLLRRALDFLSRVDALVVSLGFDTLRSDPLSYFSLEPRDFEAIGRLLRDLTLKIVLEGGYSPDIGRAAAVFVRSLET